MSGSNDSVEVRTQRAKEMLAWFGQLSRYRCGDDNPHIQWLRKAEKLPLEAVIVWMNFWYPVSRHQPQMLLLCAAAFPNQREQKLIIIENFLEEAGMLEGHHPHYVLLQWLIRKLGGPGELGKTSSHSRAEQMVSDLHLKAHSMTPAYAAGYLAGIEHAALDISAFFHFVVRLGGRSDLLTKDLYLVIHVDVEPNHILASHEIARRFIEEGTEEEKADCIAAFESVMDFWITFWNEAFALLGEPQL